MIKYELSTFMWGFPTKILSAEGGGHIYNITLTEDRANMTLVGRGDWLGLDLYKQTTTPNTFEGVVREQAANGNWYVEVTADTEALLVYDAVVIAEDYNRDFQAEDKFYNESGKTVKAYSLNKGDIFEVSETGFSATPTAGKTVTYNATTNVYTVGA